MPVLDDGGFDRNGISITIPLTPPQEPQHNGLAINGILETLVEEEKLSKDLPGPTTQARKDGDHAETDFSAPNDRTTRHSSTGEMYYLASPRQHSYRTLSTGSSDIRSKKLNGDIRTYTLNVDGMVPDTASTSRVASVAVLSPALSELTADTESLRGEKEDSISGDRSPLPTESFRNSGQDYRMEAGKKPRNLTVDVGSDRVVNNGTYFSTRPRAPRALSTPANLKSPSISSTQEYRRARTISRPEQPKAGNISTTDQVTPSSLPAPLPIPPMSLATYLQLELSSQRPSQIYIHRSPASEFPYESSQVKMERLLNFLFLPHQLEGVLWFGVLACLDNWLYIFTILPLRMIKSIFLLFKCWLRNTATEIGFAAEYVYAGSKRVYQRQRAVGQSSTRILSRTNSETQIPSTGSAPTKIRTSRQHRRLKSTPSTLQPDNKADILKGLLIIITCLILLRFDASRMYHWVRGQAAIKLYVIYNLLEVCDRLLSAIGQDVLECLFSREALERKPDGHSKVLRPAWLFTLALAYCVLHASALFLQVVTLNVAVNSYSNALITLLMSNQFVEIKGTVFKKFEKENLFQLTCADVVERFQLWHMLMIIASRNIVVDRAGITIGFPNYLAPATAATTSSYPNVTQAVPSLSTVSILPRSFMIVPSMFNSVSTYVPPIAHVLGPFVIVLGSEMLIDWLKHAYISKFNNTKPILYARFLDILAKDYYTNAFGEQNLTKRLGLPVIPLSCLMIRAGFQTYQMSVASWVQTPSGSKAATLASIQEHYSSSRPTPTSTVGLIVRRMDEFINQLPGGLSSTKVASYFTTTIVILLMFLVLLICKLILGMGLLGFSRARYQSMKLREQGGNQSHHVEGSRRVGGWGVVEVDEDKRRIIYDDDHLALQALRAREARDKAKRESLKESGFSVEGLEKVQRFEMVAKRIW